VDDSMITRKLMRKVFEDSLFRITEAEDGIEAFR